MEWARQVARLLLRLLYRVTVTGLEQFHQAGARVLVVANHTSFLDAVLLALFLPDRLTFAIDPRIARLWWVRAFLRFVDVLPIDPAKPLSTKALIKLLRADRKVMVFPEGLNALPLFHAFGLTTGAVLPLVSGVRVFFYPSPLHYRIIPEVAYEIGATILFGTNTFLAGYARFAHPYDFYRVRYVFAGAERLQTDTRQAWVEKFGIRILEGYGATETSPVLATNTPTHYRAGTVGRLLPGVAAYLDPVPGLERGGRLCVRGPNVMLGYLRHERPGALEPPRTSRGQGWYDTGDIAAIDEEGFVVIQGRAKRFAKVGAEMVSLATVEQLAEHAWPEARHAALSVPEKRKGERLVLLTERKNPERQDLLERARTEGVSELHVPKHLIATEAIPLLGAGKTDYAAARTVVEKELDAAKTSSPPDEAPASN